jgi:uncharacterized protein YcfJ
MSIRATKMLVGFTAAALTLASAGAFAQDPYNDRNDDRYDSRNDNRYDDRPGDAYDYARVVDVQPLTTRVRVSVPQRECWDETRYDSRGYDNGDYNNGPQQTRAGSTLLGAAIGAVIGHQIGHGSGRRAATVGGAVIGAAIGNNQAERRNGGYNPPPREYTSQRCETRYRDSYEERTDGYRVTYIYNGRRQVTELPYRPGDRIRVRVDVSPAE